MKTAVIDAKLHWGDPRYRHLTLTYRGRLLNQRPGTHRSEFAAKAAELLTYAKAEGFTHFRLTGHVLVEQAGVKPIPDNVNHLEITCPN